jgi:hypothetical protein
MNDVNASITGLGWVLPGNVGSGTALCAEAADPQWKNQDNRKLEDFSAKPYLESVKGYLDPAGAYLLAAAALALQLKDKPRSNDLKTDVGIVTASRYGATLSGYRFYDMFVNKGPRLASPLVFPHGYANTAGNLAAIEFGFAGPHMVLYGKQDVREGIDFALAKLADRTANSMLVGCYESAEPVVLPDGTPVLNGAIVAVVQRAEDHSGIAQFSRRQLWELPHPDPKGGTVNAALELLRNLHTQ